MTALYHYLRDQRGSSAAEFAIVAPLFVALVLGVIQLSSLMYASVQLHDATEWTARCLAVSANNPPGYANPDCPVAANFNTYGQNRYKGPRIAPSFSWNSGSLCTNSQQLVGQGTFRLSLGIVNLPLTITAKACYSNSPGS